MTQINATELRQKLQVLLTLELKCKVTPTCIRELCFVGTKADMNKVYRTLKKLGVQEYFECPFDDSDYSGRGTWIIDSTYAADHGFITFPA